MNYLEELRERRSKLAKEMASLLSDGHSLNSRERAHFADIDQDLRDLDTAIGQVKASEFDTRGAITAAISTTTA
jgi:hypothetical protein